jgi:hypothetical protein
VLLNVPPAELPPPNQSLPTAEMVYDTRGLAGSENVAKKEHLQAHSGSAGRGFVGRLRNLFN